MDVLPVAKIKVDTKYVVRDLDQKHMKDLKHKIEDQGLIEPLTVHEDPDGGFTLLAGQHRLAAITELNHDLVPAKIYMGLDEISKRSIGYMSNEARKRPSAGKRYEALNDLFEETKKELLKDSKTVSEEAVVRQMFTKSSTIRSGEVILGIIVDRLRNDPKSLVSTYDLIQNAQVPRKKIEQYIDTGVYPLMTAQNVFSALSNLCRTKPISEKEELDKKNYREEEYQNIREFLNQVVEEFIQPWIEDESVETCVNFCKRHPFDAFTKIIHDLLVEEGFPGSSTKASPLFHSENINWKEIMDKVELLKDKKIWNHPEVSQERSVKDIKARLRYIIQNPGKMFNF